MPWFSGVGVTAFPTPTPLGAAVRQLALGFPARRGSKAVRTQVTPGSCLGVRLLPKVTPFKNGGWLEDVPPVRVMREGHQPHTWPSSMA